MLMNDNEELLVYNVIQEIGLDLDENNNVVDQDFRNIVYFSGKKLKYNYHGQIAIINNNTEIYMNLLHNPLLMQHLFYYYLEKEYVFEGKYFTLFYDVNSSDPNYSAIEIKNNEYTLTSKFYYNRCLRYIDLIFQISGEYNVDLTQYDYSIQQEVR